MSRRKGKSKIGGKFTWRLIEMLESPAYCVLSLAAHRALARLEIELSAHGGANNGRLLVTSEQFASYGVRRHSVAPAIRELVALGFLEVTEAGRGGNAGHYKPSRYRLTYRQTEAADPTDGWRKITSVEAALARAKAARLRKNPHPTKRGAAPPHETGGGNGKSPPHETGATVPPHETGATLYIYGKGTERKQGRHYVQGDTGKVVALR